MLFPSRTPWLVAALLGYGGTMVVHAVAWTGTDLPDAAVWAMFIAIFPVFIHAVVTHPSATAVMRGTSLHVHVRSADVLRSASPAWIALAVGSLVYAFAVWRFVGAPPRIRLDHHLAPWEMVAVSALAAVFHAFTAMIISSATTIERRLFDPGP